MEKLRNLFETKKIEKVEENVNSNQENIRSQENIRITYYQSGVAAAKKATGSPVVLKTCLENVYSSFEDQCRQQKNEQEKSDDESEQKNDNQQKNENNEKNKDSQSNNDESDSEQEKSDSEQDNNTDSNDESEQDDNSESKPAEENQDGEQAEDPAAQEQSEPQQTLEQEAAAANANRTDADLSDQEKKAIEQQLRLLQDNPGELLKRKFKYQYEQNGGTGNSDEQRW